MLLKIETIMRVIKKSLNSQEIQNKLEFSEATQLTQTTHQNIRQSRMRWGTRRRSANKSHRYTSVSIRAHETGDHVEIVLLRKRDNGVQLLNNSNIDDSEDCNNETSKISTFVYVWLVEKRPTTCCWVVQLHFFQMFQMFGLCVIRVVCKCLEIFS